jgi:hypothetical protein
VDINVMPLVELVLNAIPVCALAGIEPNITPNAKMDRTTHGLLMTITLLRISTRPK